ncbi:copper homeostasis protein CutC [Desertivirga arenae]|uniref:copper homeostasis protein CutC n=1 Tax=Desertivirga arenae TaxID=2810309 RepID=UPI001A96FD27|nr:copper homeostasis protein CutC [Pedobacter sp. SYSU D00823]
MFKLEVCANSVRSALAAQSGGASRIELCSNLTEGGTTPSYAQISLCVKYLQIPVYVLIRPRGGDFCYSSLELEEMEMDLEASANAGCKGVVFGILNKDGTIDLDRNYKLLSYARKRGITATFHRAFDVCKDQKQALTEIIDLGFDRILSSGAAPTALVGASRLRELVELSDNRIVIMPGSGINENNISELIRITGAQEYHASARVLEDRSHFVNPQISSTHIFQSELEVTDAAKVRRLITAGTNAF